MTEASEGIYRYDGKSPHSSAIRDDNNSSVFRMKEELEQVEVGRRTLRTGIRMFQWGPVTERVIRRHRIKTLFLLFMDVDGPSSANCRAALENVARIYRSREILHVIVPVEHLQPFQFFLGDDPQNEIPFVVVVEVNKGFKKYRFISSDKGQEQRAVEMCDKNSMASFEEEYFKGIIAPWLRSEDAIVMTYEDEDGGKDRISAHTLSGKLFHSRVLSPGFDALVLFYAPWCGHCKRFQKSFSELARRFRKVKGIKFFQIDATKNDVDHKEINVDRVPYVRFFKDGKKDSPLKFDHSEKDVMLYGTDFLKGNAATSVDTSMLVLDDNVPADAKNDILVEL
eukprot:TRINITY_DN167745_c0_g1_i1.p1 TRINITY_DN167745_c0_g1~~TRINITY_DN167745_c0_g1_i1.p1  ORF type:complete len:360 (-),score=41.98 TRINITY_DN167745_c0_g1_i1:250-1266(-)